MSAWVKEDEPYCVFTEGRPVLSSDWSDCKEAAVALANSGRSGEVRVKKDEKIDWNKNYKELSETLLRFEPYQGLP